MSLESVGYIPVSPLPVPNTRGSPVRSGTGSEAKADIRAIPQTRNSSRDQQTQIVDLERVSRAFNRKLQFVVDHSSNEVLVKVIDKKTDRVIKVIPPEELQRLHRNVKEAIGLLFDEMA